MSEPGDRPVEGIDYCVEGGRWVFTAAYHRKRGHCCASGCRHCPFGNAPADREGATNGTCGDAMDTDRESA